MAASEFEQGVFQGETNARLNGHDQAIEALVGTVGTVDGKCDDIKLILAKQNGLRSLGKTAGAGAGGAGFIVGLITILAKFLG